MLELIEKAEKRLRNMPAGDLDAQQLALLTILPLFKQMQRNNDKAFEEIDGNFRELFMTLNLVDEHKNFLDTTFNHITGLHRFVDEILLTAGYVEVGEQGVAGGIRPSESMPSNLLEKLLAFQANGAQWFEQYAAVRAAAEEALDEDEDPDGDPGDYDEDGDGDGDGDDDPTNDALPVISPEQPASAEATVSEAPNG